MDKKEIELAEKIKFWEEQEEINKILIDRILKLENQLLLNDVNNKLLIKSLRLSLVSFFIALFSVISTVFIWVN